ncbi:MAG: selenocysteine-specific translation elongation factor [Chitinispirillaceae bacterium]|nr:selenocysteine-specific translation elongation factor [Chitinispirillaceae bacterium]
MPHVILGTAGHIDHGKTTLIRALTGIECDTHREEQRRGITINLGFAHLQLPGGETIGIVDVPGHRDFIHTMVSGASGIDLALLVVAADGGIMPQTREHLAIMDMLGVKRGVIAVTRIDLVDQELLSMAVEETAAFIKGTFLEGCAILPVSSKTGDGIETLRSEIARLAAAVKSRPGSGLFRLYIDRIFTVTGFGTVVTGSVLGGRTTVGSRLYLLPGEKEVRIRRLERYGEEVPEVAGGDRASLNLAGLSREEFIRGMMVADRPLRPTRMIDANITLFEHAHPVHLWSRIHFHLGTFDAQVRMHLIDTDTLRPGETAVVQMHLPVHCIAQAGDRLILRSTSNDQTIGGGTVIDAAPLHHRRRPAHLVEKLHSIADGSLPTLLEAEIKKHAGGITREELAGIINCSPGDIDDATASFSESVISLTDSKEVFFIDADAARRLGTRIVNTITAYHRRNPLDDGGRTTDELQGMMGLTSSSQGKMLHLLLLRLVDEKTLKKVEHTWALTGHTVEPSPVHKKAIADIDLFFRGAGMQAPLETDLGRYAHDHGIDDQLLRQVLSFLSAKKHIIPIEGTWLHESVVAPIRGKLLSELVRHPDGLTVAQFRDLVEGNRKICLLLYTLFDREGITERDGDVRKITERGRELQTAATA